MSIDAFFNDLTGGMTRPEAFLALLLAAVAVDRTEDHREVEEKRALEKRSRTLAALKSSEVADIKARLRPRLAPEQIDGLINDACQSLVSDDIAVRLSIFAHCCDIIFADHKVHSLERTFLRTLILKLQIDEAQAEKLLRALKEKNQI
jgi:uncharacterized tellurite resistance protein B-like protein